MSLRILIDTNLSPSWVEVLQDAGFEACHWYKLGAPNAESPGVFQIRTEDVSPVALSPRAIELLNRFKPQLSSGALVIVDEMRERIRILPLGNRNS